MYSERRTPGTPTTSSPTPASSPVGVHVPHVYNHSEGVATSEFRAVGFQVRSIYVCSSSVVSGNVRQVLTDAGDQDGAVVDDQGGVTTAGGVLPRGTQLVMKISTDVACNLPTKYATPTAIPSATTTPSTAATPTRRPTP